MLKRVYNIVGMSKSIKAAGHRKAEVNPADRRRFMQMAVDLAEQAMGIGQANRKDG